MTWTVVDEGDKLNVRAVIDTKTEQQEITALIFALQKRLNEENRDGHQPETA